MEKIKILIVEDQGLFRDMLRRSLSLHSHIDVVGSVPDGHSAIEAFQATHPDVVLLDIELGDGPNGIEIGHRIREESPGTGIIILSVHKDKQYIASIPVSEVSGWSYLLKQSIFDISTLLRAIEGSAAGLTVLDPAIVDELRPKRGSRIGSLTPRQREVLKLIAEGYNNSSIAHKLVLGENSVENHINAFTRS